MVVFEHSIHVAVWDYLVKNPFAEKISWPGWSDLLELDHDLLRGAHYCMACYHQDLTHALIPYHDRIYTQICLYCPLLWPGGQCARGDKDGLFNVFKNCETPHFKSAYAKLIRDLPIRSGVICR